MFSRLGYSIKQSFSQMGRNKGMYFTSIMAITAMMLILGLFFVSFVNVNLFARTIQDNYNVVQVYMDNDNSSKLTDNIGKKIEDIKGVEKAELVTKKEALQTLKKRWGDNAYLLDNLQENPLPDSYSVYVADEAAAEKVAETAVDIKGVDDITYYQETIDKLAKVSRFIEIGSVVVMAFLIVISIVIVANTIKLTVMNREKEISIMKYLGATDWFIRGPFLLGGIFIGLIAAAASTGLVYLIYSKIIDILGKDVARILSVSLVPADQLIMYVLASFVLLGVGIGAIGSMISIRRFLMK